MWKRLKTRTLLQHPRITIVEDDVKLPEGKKIKYLRFIGKRHGVTVICLKNDNILLQKEYSYPVNKLLYQFPGGKIEAGETPNDAALRELVEESGLKPKSLVKLGWYYTDNRRTNSKMHVVLAKNVAVSKKNGGDIEEIIKSEWMTIVHFKRMIKGGEINNYSVLAAWALFQARR